QAAAAPSNAAAPNMKPNMTPVRRAREILSFACAMTWSTRRSAVESVLAGMDVAQPIEDEQKSG
ncbi:MAG: hypothetical protein WA592_21935, partial [Pseudolabrys sp.]